MNQNSNSRLNSRDERLIAPKSSQLKIGEIKPNNVAQSKRENDNKKIILKIANNSIVESPYKTSLNEVR